MNANMKRLLIFALVPVTVWGIGSTFTKQKIDRIGVNTESQITMEDTTRFSSGTASTVPYLDASKDLVSSSVTPAELGYLSGVSSSIQTQIDGKQDPVSGTANEIDFASDIIGLADNPILPGNEGVTLPSGTTAQRDSTPPTGQLRWNSDNTEAEIYDGTQWGSVGGGAGGSRLNLLDDPSFEKGVANGSCTGCTASQDTTDYLATPNNEASLKMAFSAASGNYTWTESTSAQYSNVAGTVKAWIKTSASDCHFDELVNGTQSQTVAIGSSDEWKQYIINGTTGTTSYGWRVRCDTSITDDVFVDETFAGAAEPDTFDIGTASLWGSVEWDGVGSCVWINTTSGSYANFGADTDCDNNARTIKGMYNSTDGGVGATDGQYPRISFSHLPAGHYKIVATALFYDALPQAQCSWRFSDGTDASSPNTPYSGTSVESGVGSIIGEFDYSTNQGATTFEIQARPETSSQSCAIYSDGTASPSQRKLKISVYHYPSPQKVVAASCSGLECVNEFSAKISDAGTVTDENVDWISGNCSTDAGTGQFDCTLTESTMNLNCTIGAQESSAANVTLATQLTNAGAGTLRYRTLNSSSTSAGLRNTVVNCQRSGSDYKQFDSRFIPVVDDEIVIVRGAGNGGGSITADVTDIDFTELEDNNSLWSGTAFVPNKTGDYIINGSTNATGSHAGTMQLFENGTLYKLIATNNITAAIKTFSGAIRLTAGNSYTIRSSVGMTLSNSSSNHWIQIHRLKDSKKAFIGNLTPKEFVQSTGSSSPRLYSAKIGATGAVSNEIGDWINGNCTNASPMVCTFNSGTWSSTPPNCTISDVSTANAQFCEFNGDPGTSTMSIKCYNYLGSDQTTAIEKNVICHGVQ